MIDFQEYLDAGFTEAQARLLMSRDLRTDARYDILTATVSRGFADMQARFGELTDSVAQLAATVASLARQTADGFETQDRRFEHIEERLDEHDRRFDGIDQRLDDHDRRFDAIDRRFDEIDQALRLRRDYPPLRLEPQDRPEEPPA